ncbi:S1C family serine protease [Levilactobacillus bambusae]|uniref:Serine protease n=1 Tax=Levilactobacillus bambusae TaxID=2024736 RepID=A0A2V1N2M0_9LACO|nr:trypsin-like peptidase domain-containing protein [Levilactobacillus bambusae]PWG00505.1 serine protease [Levilactobacillus bambusae]
MDNNDNQQNNNQRPKQHGSFSLGKVAGVALLAGLLGGGIAYGGANYFANANEASDTAVPVSSNKSGNTKTSNVTVNVSTQANKAYNSIKGAVVSVINLQRENTSSSNGLEAIFGNGSSSSSKSGALQAASEGSGVIYKKSKNVAYIVTNNHVVSGANSLEVVLSNGKKIDADLVGKDSVTDLAVLKINGADVKTVASFGNSDDIKVGETALAIGSPLGTQYASTLTEGIISAKKRTVQTTNSSGAQTGNATAIQTDAAINPGNSGGPLTNIAGQVIGINSSKIASDDDGTSVEGIGFAIPSNEVVKIINQLVSKGKVERPALGITYVDLTNVSTSQQKSILKLPSDVSSGVVVMGTSSSNSPARAAGLKKYDVITEMNGKKISDTSTLQDLLYKYDVGDTIKLTYYRNGSKKTADVKLTETTSQMSSSSKSSAES